MNHSTPEPSTSTSTTTSNGLMGSLHGMMIHHKARPNLLLASSKSFASTSWRALKKISNASFGSVKTAATSLLGDRSDDTQSMDDDDDESSSSSNSAQDSVLLWEGLQEEDSNGDSNGEEEEEEDVLEESFTEVELLDKLNCKFMMDDTFHDSYSLGKSLGQGSFGSVRRCTPKRSLSGDSQESFAVKTVPLRLYDPEEIEILQDLQDCPHIVQVQEVFHDHSSSRRHSARRQQPTEDNVMIVMEEIAGGELLERIASKECYTEREAKIVFRTLLETVQFCHEQGIAHCDIKPENIMCVSKESDTDIKLVDFGLARRFQTQEGEQVRLMEMHGSPEYAAPEVFNRDEEDGGDGCDERCDIWSMGTVLYVLLAGYAPFEADTPDEMIQVVGQGKIKFHKKYWKNISREAKILIARMLTVDPDKRCTIEEALNSPWFLEEEDDQE